MKLRWSLGCTAAVIWLLALGLRLYGLGAESVWFDEVSAIDNALEPIGGFLDRLVRTETNPPLYFLMLRGWIALFGDGPEAVRLLSVAGGMLGLVLLFWLARELCTPRGALLTLLLGAVSAFGVYYAQEARMYSWHLTFCLGSTLYYWRDGQRPTARSYGLWLGFSLAAIYTHLFGWLLLAAQAAHQLFVRKSSNRRTLCGMAMLAGAFLPWFVWATLPQISLRAGRWWVGRPTIKDGYYVLWRFSSDSKALVIGCGALILWGVVSSWRRRSEHPLEAPLLLLFWLALPGVMWLHAQVMTPVFASHYFLFCLPAYWMLVARGLERLPDAACGVTLALLLGLGVMQLHAQYRDLRKFDWRGIVSIVRESPVKRVYVTGGVSSLLYYDRRERLGLEIGSLLAGQISPRYLTPQELERKLLPEKEFWVVVTRFKPAKGLDGLRGWLKRHYLVRERHPGLLLCRRRPD